MHGSLGNHHVKLGLERTVRIDVDPTTAKQALRIDRFLLGPDIRALLECRFLVTDQRHVQQLYSQTPGLGQLNLVLFSWDKRIIGDFQLSRTNTGQFQQLSQEISE